MTEKWDWFSEQVEKYFSSLLKEYRFVQQVGPEFEPDEDKDNSRGYDYENDKGIRLGIDIMLRQTYRKDLMQIYWLRVYVGSVNLKTVNSEPTANIEDMYEAKGWTFEKVEQAPEIMEKVTNTLKDYLESMEI